MKFNAFSAKLLINLELNVPNVLFCADSQNNYIYFFCIINCLGDKPNLNQTLMNYIGLGLSPKPLPIQKMVIFLKLAQKSTYNAFHEICSRFFIMFLRYLAVSAVTV